MRLAESGDRVSGLEAIRRAVKIREQLAGENFAAYGPDEEPCCLINPKKRFFMDSPLNAGDGEKFYVTNQWGIGNIGQFIGKARDLGYVIVNADFKALFDAYKAAKNSEEKPARRRRRY